MKAIFNIMVVGVFPLFTSISNVSAQNMNDINSNMKKVLVDTTLVNAYEFTILPGQKTVLHSHPAHFFYAQSDGKLIIHYADGTDAPFEFKAGDSGFSSPERPHITENVGDKPVKFILVELKEHPYIVSDVKKDK